MDGRPLAVDTRKATALLAYLASRATPSGVTRSRRCSGPRTTPSGRGRRCGARCRRCAAALGGRWLATDRDLVSLDGAGIGLDVAELRRLLAECATHGHAPARPASVASSRFAPRPRSTVAHSSRASGSATRPSSTTGSSSRPTTLAARARRARSTGSPRRSRPPATAEAIAAARRRLALDPLHEPAHRQLIRRYAAGGDRSAALEQYRECVRVLDRELGVRAARRDDRALPRGARGDIGRGRSAAGAVPPRAGAARRSSDGPRARRADRGVRARSGPTAGSRSSSARPASASRGSARSSRHVTAAGGNGVVRALLPGGGRARLRRRRRAAPHALAAAGRRRRGRRWLAEAARLLPELGPAPERAVDSTAARCGSTRRCAGSCPRARRRASRRGASSTTRTGPTRPRSRLLLYLAHRLRGRPLMLVVSGSPRRSRRSTRSRRLLRARRDAACSRSGGYRPRTSSSSSRRGHDGELGARLHRESGGLPFFVVEYLDALAREDADAPNGRCPAASANCSPLGSHARRAGGTGRRRRGRARRLVRSRRRARRERPQRRRGRRRRSRSWRRAACSSRADGHARLPPRAGARASSTRE